MGKKIKVSFQEVEDINSEFENVTNHVEKTGGYAEKNLNSFIIDMDAIGSNITTTKDMLMECKCECSFTKECGGGGGGGRGRSEQ